MRTNRKRLSGIHILRLRYDSWVDGWTAGRTPSRDDVVVRRFEGLNELAVGSVEHHAPADLAGVDESLAHRSVDLQIHQRAFESGIHVPVVGRQNLKIPAQFSCLDIERNHRVRVKRVSRTAKGGCPRCRLTNARINE